MERIFASEDWVSAEGFRGSMRSLNRRCGRRRRPIHSLLLAPPYLPCTSRVAVTLYQDAINGPRIVTRSSWMPQRISPGQYQKASGSALVPSKKLRIGAVPLERESWMSTRSRSWGLWEENFKSASKGFIWRQQLYLPPVNCQLVRIWRCGSWCWKADADFYSECTDT